MNNNRDDFPTNIKETAAKRVNYICSCPTCHCLTISKSDEGNDKYSNVGVAAHICAAAPHGKRYDEKMSSKERKSIDNCIWLCQTHAKLIDTDETKYTVDLLKQWKNETEEYVQKMVKKIKNLDNSEIDLLEQWYEKFEISNWSSFTIKLLRPCANYMEITTYDKLVDNGLWLDKNIHLIKNDECQSALKIFSDILKKLLSTFFAHVEEKRTGIYTVIPDSYNSGEYSEYGINGGKKHNDLIWDLTFELTKSINKVCDIIRDKYPMDFANQKVDLCCTTNVLEGNMHVIVEYQPNEMQTFEFESFMKDNSKRVFKQEE